MLSYSDLSSTLGFSPNTWLSMSSRNFLNCETHPSSALPASLSLSANTISTSMSNFIEGALWCWFRVRGLLLLHFRNVAYQALYELVMISHYEIEVHQVYFKYNCSFACYQQ